MISLFFLSSICWGEKVTRFRFHNTLRKLLRKWRYKDPLFGLFITSITVVGFTCVGDESRPWPIPVRVSSRYQLCFSTCCLDYVNEEKCEKRGGAGGEAVGIARTEEGKAGREADCVVFLMTSGQVRTGLGRLIENNLTEMTQSRVTVPHASLQSMMLVLD